MKYATVVTAAENLGKVPHMYYISQADEAGEPVQMGQLARVKFANGVDAGCSEADLLGIVMHRLAAKAQESDVGVVCWPCATLMPHCRLLARHWM